MNPSKIITWKLRLENEGGRGSWNSWWSILSLQEIAYHLITAGHHDRSNISNRLGTETSLPLSSPCRYSQFFCLLCHNRDSDLLPSPSPRLTLIQVGKWPTRLQNKPSSCVKMLQIPADICNMKNRFVDPGGGWSTSLHNKKHIKVLQLPAPFGKEKQKSWPWRESNPQPFDLESNALPLRHKVN